MSKILKFNSEAREKLLKGINILTDAVATTLGPKGRNVALDKKWGAPQVVHDGVTVAKEIDLEDPFENMGAQLLKEAASKTADVAGDGTTTATILAKAIVLEGLKNISAGANPMILKKGVEKAVIALVEELKKMSKKISTQEEVDQKISVDKIVVPSDPNPYALAGAIGNHEDRVDAMNAFKQGLLVALGEAEPILLLKKSRQKIQFDLKEKESDNG